MGKSQRLNEETLRRIEMANMILENTSPHLQISFNDIIESLKDSNRFNHIFEVPGISINAQLNVQGVLDNSKKESLSASIKIDGQRIKGIDYQTQHGGFHQHFWTRDNRESKYKVLDDLNNTAKSLSPEDIIYVMLEKLNIVLSNDEDEGQI